MATTNSENSTMVYRRGTKSNNPETITITATIEDGSDYKDERQNQPSEMVYKGFKKVAKPITIERDSVDSYTITIERSPLVIYAPALTEKQDPLRDAVIGAASIETNMANVTLDGINLSSAELIRANFREASLRGANFEGSDLFEADLRGADLTGANLRNVNLTGAKLAGAIFNGADLSGADCEDADFATVYHEVVDLLQPDFENANLTGVNFEGAKLHGVDFSDACTLGAKFTDADLIQAVFDGSEMNVSVLKDAILFCTSFKEATIWFDDIRAAYNWAKASKMNPYTNFVGAKFRLASTDGINLHDLDLFRIIMPQHVYGLEQAIFFKEEREALAAIAA
jgi:uncharacterized protein YjbI with pentapeptide repeats